MLELFDHFLICVQTIAKLLMIIAGMTAAVSSAVWLRSKHLFMLEMIWFHYNQAMNFEIIQFRKQSKRLLYTNSRNLCHTNCPWIQ